MLFGGLMLLLIWLAFSKGHYFVAEPDECTYFNSARIFSEANSVVGPVATEGKTSIIGNCNWYGPMYSILYGTIAKVFGVSVYDFIVFNVFCLACALLLIYRAGFDKQIRLLIITSYMSGYVFVVYIYQLYPEPLHLLFSTILILQLRKIYDAFTNNTLTNKLIFKYTLLVLLFSIFRVTTLFWEFGLIAFVSTKKQAYKMGGLIVLVLCIVLVYMHYFNAPYNAGILPTVLSEPLSVKELFAVAKTMVLNTYKLITHAVSFYEGLYVLFLLFAVFNFLRTRNRFLLSTIVIAMGSIIVLLAFYVPDSSFLNKQTAYFYPLLLIPIFYIGLSEVKMLSMIILLLFAPVTYIKAYGQIELRKHTFDINEQFKAQSNKVEAIEHYMGTGKPQHILLVLDDINYAPYIYIYMHLPFSNKDGYSISYIESRFPYFPVNRQLYNQCFVPKGNLHADFILSKDTLSLDSISLLYSTDIFFFYRNNRK